LQDATGDGPHVKPQTRQENWTRPLWRFLATDQVHGAVAVKVLRQQPGEDAAQWQSHKDDLLKEGQQLRAAKHDNVVGVHYLVEADTDDAILLVMELCQSGSLQKSFDAGPMRLGDVLRVSTQVALGLQALHTRGMLHRDIKPSNLLLSITNAVQLGDFGLVTDIIILGYASQAGYLDHLAPEVYTGLATSVKSDIWALGMTIYRLIHGANWYARLPANPRDVIEQGGFAKSLPWLPHVSDKWRRFVRTMMHDDTQHRYQNANQVLSALAALSVEPNWKCKVTNDEIRWTRKAKGRRYFVVWNKLSARKYKWSAWSEPIGKGNRRSLGGSNGTVTYSKSDRQLRNFFAM
jgi:serine/threonine protein kinase